MNAPDRSAEVATLANLFPPMPSGETEEQTDNRKRTFLINIVIPFLNWVDGGSWGALRKQSKPNVIADIVVWRDTNEHFDVLSDTGVIWAPKGVIPDFAWKWEQVGLGGPVPVPSTPPVTPSPVETVANLSELSSQLAAVDRDLSDDISSAGLTLQEQNERIFANLTAQISELRQIVLSLPRTITISTPVSATLRIGGLINTTVELKPKV